MRELDAHFWRNWQALRPYSVKRPRVHIPAQRVASPTDDRWEAYLRAAYRSPRPREDVDHGADR